jgi:hypothetical protein
MTDILSDDGRSDISPDTGVMFPRHNESGVPAPAHRWSVKRHFTAQHLNRIANHPTVRPWVGGVGELDLSDAVSNPANFVLLNERGGCFFENCGNGVFEVHTLFEPEGRGAEALHAVQDALHWMFTQTDCVELQTKVPAGNKGALGLVRAIHGREHFRRENAWRLPDGQQVGIAFYALNIHEWAGRCDATKAYGEWFHDKLEAAKIAQGGTTEIHDDDEAHDRYVGATVEMMLAGQVDKALWFYNRWARFAGYTQVRQVSTAPVLIDIQDAVISLKPNDFEVVLCR